MLTGVCSTAKRLKLYKKGGQRHAFANFTDVQECINAFKAFSEAELMEQKVFIDDLIFNRMF